MKLKIIAIILLFVITPVVSQEKINQFNEKGERIGVWKKYYANKRIRYVGQFENGKEIGVFKYYSVLTSKHPVAIKTFDKNTNSAQVQFYTNNGLLKSEGQLNGKTRIGKWVYYQPDGKTILSFENYKNGLLNGESKTFYPNKQVAEILNFKNDKLHGNIKHYTKKGTILDDVNYVDGILHGYAKYYNEKGDLIYEGTYDNDEKLDDWNFYIDGIPAKKDNVGQ